MTANHGLFTLAVKTGASTQDPAQSSGVEGKQGADLAPHAHLER